MEELIEKFELQNVQKAGAYFDIERLDFFNSHYLKTMDLNLVYNKLLLHLKRYDLEYYELISKYDSDYNKKILNELKTRIKNFSEFKEFSSIFYTEYKTPSIDLVLNPKMKIDNLDLVIKSLNISLNILKDKNKDFSNIDEIKNIFVEKIKEADMKNGQVLWPVRCALS
jgi:glutamyl/glutaminyl-tRNA synthetase